MKNGLNLIFTLLLPILSFSQCDPSQKYDKIVSGYHSSVAQMTDGTFVAWGGGLAADGTSGQLSPTTINSTNYSTLPANDVVYKATIGGKGGAGNQDQAIILTNSGLYAWGLAGTVLNTTLKSTTAFGKITSPTGATTAGLPTGVTPQDVQMFVATYQTLMILTKPSAGGNVYILTQLTTSAEANGVANASSTGGAWKQVKIDASTNLSNVVAIRGQATDDTYNAFMAMTSSGQVYTWGNSTYLGNGTAFAARNYATLMTLPTEFNSSNLPKMIGVTGGTSPAKNTYYVLSNSGSLYALGDNSGKQCGDFTTTERTSWVNVKINSTTNFTNVVNFTPQEHCAVYPGVAAVTSDGKIYTWGNNASSMLGRTSDGTITGTIGTTYDPGLPISYQAGYKAVSAELGGHTLVFLREGTSQFCYVGHRTTGSMGDGTSTDSGNGSYYASCSGTPTLSLCGYVPVVASPVTSEISVNQPQVSADGTSVSVITIKLKDASGNYLTTSGGNVSVFTTLGTLGTVVDNNNGTYTVLLTSSTTVGNAVITYSVNGTTATNSTSVNMVASGSLSTDSSVKSEIVIYPNPFNTDFVVKGVTGSLMLKLFDATGKFILQKSVKNNDKIDLQNFPKGIYFVRIGTKTIKLIKQ
jgi:alpha-tubulin suppressor-like RCC1 family protein